MARPATPKAPTTTYRLSPAVDAWLEAERERLGISKNAVVEMKLLAAMQADSQPFTDAQQAEIEQIIDRALIASRIAEQKFLRDVEALGKLKPQSQPDSPHIPGKDERS